MRIAEHVVDLIGNTPLVKLTSVTGENFGTVAAKVEYLNPGGSSKDRIAVKMIDAAEASGELKPGGTIVEPTSGNTGIGLALVAQKRGYKCVFVCPDKVSEDKRNVLRAYGARWSCAPRPSRRTTRTATTASPTASPVRSPALEAQPVLQPGRTGEPLRDHRPRDLGRHRRQDHALRRGRRHRRHHHRHRPLPQGSFGRQGQGHRRRPRGLRLLRRHRSSVSGRRRRRRLLAVGIRPVHPGRDHRRLGCRFLRDDASPRPRGGTAGRRFLRYGRRRCPRSSQA